MELKCCSRCKRNLDRECFSRNRSTPDGLAWECRVCRVVMRRDARNPVTIRAERQRYKAARASALRRWREADRQRMTAHRAVYRASRQGLLDRPAGCSICGELHSYIQAHHDDYAKPLDVIWVCPRCHRVLDHRRRQKPAPQPEGQGAEL